MSSNERFGSRFGMMLAMLGMAVGTGNIWRFPRIAAANGGGEFIVAWIAFLFLWSIPLILLEFGTGRLVRGGPIRAFLQTAGSNWAWMGAFVAFVSTAILFYYSVVSGWTIRYTVASLTGEIPETTPGAFWASYTESAWPVVTHGVAIFLAGLVVARGVRMIERVTRVLMPLLVLLVVALAGRALFLPGAEAGLAYLFSVDWAELGRAELWLAALTQNAWDTGAGWGLVLCYAAYLRENEDTTLNAFILPTANNCISLLAGIMVLCTVFSVVPALAADFLARPDALAAFPDLAASVAAGHAVDADLLQETIFASSNTGITFVWMPQLFATIPGGRFLMLLFFAALSVAAFTSLVALVELATRVAIDAGLERPTAIKVVVVVAFVLGLPSALSLAVLNNQDWVWGVALMVSGLFFALAISAYGLRRFREQQLNHEHSDLRVGVWWEWVIRILVPLQAVVLLAWWLYQAWTWDPEGWLDPIAEANVGTVLFQFALVLTALLIGNRWLARHHRLPRD